MALQVPPVQEIAANVQSGVNAPVRVLTQTQATPPSSSNTPQAFTNPGVGSTNDDNPPVNRERTEQVINDPAGWLIKPQPNVLDQYASYTYNLSWYMLTPIQYAAFMNSYGRASSSNWSLLMQSGGAPQQQSNTEFGGRNQYFTYDYYMDNLVLESRFPGKGTTSSHNVIEMSFTVVEPNGITFVRNLRKAVIDLLKQNSAAQSGNAGATVNTINTATTETNYASAQFVMGINFYGYDDQGNLVKSQKTGVASAASGANDINAIVQKFIPFQVNNVEFKVQSKGTIEYTIKASPIVVNTAISSARGSIPFNLSLVGSTLNEVLQGNPVVTNNNSGGGRDETSTSTPSSVSVN